MARVLSLSPLSQRQLGEGPGEGAAPAQENHPAGSVAEAFVTAGLVGRRLLAWRNGVGIHRRAIRDAA